MDIVFEGYEYSHVLLCIKLILPLMFLFFLVSLTKKNYWKAESMTSLLKYTCVVMATEWSGFKWNILQVVLLQEGIDSCSKAIADQEGQLVKTKDAKKVAVASE